MEVTNYKGVEFSEEQKKRLKDDLDKIDSINAQIAAMDAEFNDAEARVQYISGENARCGNDQSCHKWCLTEWDIARGRQTVASQRKDSLSLELVTANKNYNDDLNAIQNEINIATQASIASTTAATQLAQNQVTLNQNSPAVLAAKLKAESEARLKALDLQATLDKQKKENNVKMGFFVIAVIIVGFAGFFIIKRLL